MVSTLLAATVLLQGPSVQNFDGLKLEVVAPPVAPITAGIAKTWAGSLNTDIDGKSQTTALYSVVITDLKTVTPKLTEDQVLARHERTARSARMLGAPNYRRSFGKIGSHKLIVLNGSAIAAIPGAKPINAYWTSFAFIHGDKVYEFSQFSTLESHYKQAMSRIAAMSFTPPGGVAMTAAALPKDFNGEYVLGNLPFVLTTPQAPAAATAAPPDPSFDDQYTAALTEATGLSYVYKVRKAKEGEKRTDVALFRDLVNDFVPVQSVPEAKLAVKNGSATVELDFQTSGKPYRAHLRFERVGDWIAVLAGTAPKPKADVLKAVSLKRVKIGGS